MKKNILLPTLVTLLGFLSIGAIYGGGSFLISPDGALLNIPISFLHSSPFTDFFIPGLILISVFGIFPLVLIVGLIKKPKWKICEMFNLLKDMHWAWSFCIYLSIGLIIWIQVQMALLQIVFWLQTFYMAYALIMLIVLLLTPVRKLFYKDNNF